MKSFTSSVQAVDVVPLSGEVFVHNREGYQRVKDVRIAAIGDKIFARHGGFAKIVYSKDCILTLKAGSVLTIVEGTPYSASPMGLKKSSNAQTEAKR